MQNINLQTKIQELQSKIIQLNSSIENLKQNGNSKIYKYLNSIQLSLKDIQADCKTNTLSISHLQSQISDLKQTIKQVKKEHTSDINLEKKEATTLQNQVHTLQKQVNDIKVHLTQNDGQTNQCYIAVEKLQKVIKQHHPIQKVQQASQLEDAQKQIKKVFYKIIAGIVVSLGTAILIWVGSKYWTAIINDLYNSQCTQQVEARTINNNTSKGLEDQSKKTTK